MPLGRRAPPQRCFTFFETHSQDSGCRGGCPLRHVVESRQFFESRQSRHATGQFFIVWTWPISNAYANAVLPHWYSLLRHLPRHNTRGSRFAAGRASPALRMKAPCLRQTSRSPADFRCAASPKYVFGTKMPQAP